MRSPPVPSREPKCLKEVPQDPGDIAGVKLVQCINLMLMEAMDVSV